MYNTSGVEQLLDLLELKEQHIIKLQEEIRVLKVRIIIINNAVPLFFSSFFFFVLFVFFVLSYFFFELQEEANKAIKAEVQIKNEVKEREQQVADFGEVLKTIQERHTEQINENAVLIEQLSKDIKLKVLLLIII